MSPRTYSSLTASSSATQLGGHAMASGAAWFVHPRVVMHHRDWIAANVGLALGLTPVTSSAITGSELAQMVLGCSVAAPLIVSLIAQRHVMLLALVPAVVMATTVNVMHVMMAAQRPSAGAFVWGIISFVAFLAAPAFIVAGIVKLIRYLRGSLEDEEVQS